MNIQQLIYLAGIAQIVLATGSIAIPSILNFKSELAKVRTLIKQMFWTYAAYILVINLCFGLISVFASADLIDGSRLALCITFFITIYWVSRISIQFFYFDRKDFPAGFWHQLAEVALVLLFIFLSGVYGWAAYHNYNHN